VAVLAWATSPPLAVGFARAGFTVRAIDTDGAKIEALRAGTSYIRDVPDEALTRC
jgi:UDP-N-acetyl-D-glucosamine dehydrogenase